MVSIDSRRAYFAAAMVVLVSGCGGGGGPAPTTPPPTPPPTSDTVPPSTSLTSVPRSSTNQTTAEFLFASNEAGSTFECQLDDDTIASCTSPHTESDLSEGEHTFRVRATDAAGNTDATWATVTWYVDLTSPTLRLVSRPLATTPSNRAIFHFVASEEETTLECQRDELDAVSCTNPWILPGIVQGDHSISVTATDPAGNVSDPVTFDWTIAPNTTPSHDIDGTVTITDGEPGGLWVIAQTTDTPTPFRKIVVTADDGRFVIPDVPSDAAYRVWLRGYGIEDSDEYWARSEHVVDFEISLASTPQAAAQSFPANYWLSMINLPDPSEFPGTGSNGLGNQMEYQGDWVDGVKDRCQLCHQMGHVFTRVFPEDADYASTRAGWDARVRLGEQMNNQMNAMGRQRSLDVFVDWTDRIDAGEVPPTPPRPSEYPEQNIVISQWTWTDPGVFVHDNISTDKRHPDLERYSYGRVFGVSQSHAKMPATNPGNNQTEDLFMDNLARNGNAWNIHNPMLDEIGILWTTSSVRRDQNPDWCFDPDSPNESIRRFPISQSGRQLAFYDLNNQETQSIDTCYATHHLQFEEVGNGNRLWTSGDFYVIGWLDTEKYLKLRANDEPNASRDSQGWCPVVLDHNGDGELGEYTSPFEPLNPTKDAQQYGFAYGIIPNPLDGSVWFTQPYPNRVPGQILRLDPETCLTEKYHPPYDGSGVPPEDWGFSPRGIDIDDNGLLWTALSGSGHIASFDRSKCAILNGPQATGHHCPEGWTLYPTPGPNFANAQTGGSADFHYYIWVDQDSVFGLGRNVPITNGTNSDSLLALVPETGQIVTIRVPYPLGFYQRGLDGRIDDPNTGWKGRALWASNNTSVLQLIEDTGRGDIMKFQLRDHPLDE